MKIKVCGITRLEDARYCAGAGADYLGFIQYSGSPRFVPPERAKEIIAWVYGPEPVGVFVDEDVDRVNAIASDAGFAVVQLHGSESPEYCADVARPVIRALRVFPDTQADDLRRQMDAYLDYVSLFLLDTGRAGARGGTGEVFDWRVARDLSEEYQFLLAGGLSAANVSDAADLVRPFGIDASSSLESEPGVKDVDKLADFFEAVRTVGA